MRTLKDILHVKLLVIALSISLLMGIRIGLIPIGLLFMLELIPERERYDNPWSQGSIVTYLWRFYGSWYAIWFGVPMGAWVLMGPVFVLILFAFCLVFQLMLSYWLPIISIRLTCISTPSMTYRFFVFGTWWGDGMIFLWFSNGQIIFASQNEFGWTRHIFDCSPSKSIKPIGFVDAVLLGTHPQILNAPFGELPDEDEARIRHISNYFKDETLLNVQLIDFFHKTKPRRESVNLIGSKVYSI